MYWIMKQTVAKKLVESIKYLKQNQLVIVSNVTYDVVQALYVPKGATKFRINAEYRLEDDLPIKSESERAVDQKVFGSMFHDTPHDALTIDASIQHLRSILLVTLPSMQWSLANRNHQTIGACGATH
jgi:hypothetical protein